MQKRCDYFPSIDLQHAVEVENHSCLDGDILLMFRKALGITDVLIKKMLRKVSHVYGGSKEVRHCLEDQQLCVNFIYISKRLKFVRVNFRFFKELLDEISI